MKGKRKIKRVASFRMGVDKYKDTSDVEWICNPIDLEKKKQWWGKGKFYPAARNVSPQKFQTETRVDELLLWRSLNSRRHILVSGKAGAGKSNLLERFIEHWDLDNNPKKMYVCAPTGIAAFNIGGETLHRQLGLGLADERKDDLFRKISRNPKKFQKTWTFLKGADVLVVDEISMIDPKFFETLDYLFKKARQNSKPFGGVLLLMLGDFLQLGPSSKKTVEFVFQTDVWKTLKLSRIYLDRSFRQKSGQWLDILNAIRTGELNKEMCTFLHDFQKNTSVFPNSTGGVLDIYPLRKSVQTCNRQKLKDLAEGGEKIFMFKPYLHVEPRGKRPICAVEAKTVEILIEKCEKNLMGKFPVESLEVCVGAQVMMRCNFYMDKKVFNGSLGKVVSIENNTIGVKFVTALDIIFVDRYQFRLKTGDTTDVVMNQFPLSLGWATTIHKVQGLTLDNVRVDASSCFATGQLYTALSRVRRLQDLILLGFNRKSLLTDADAIEFETSFLLKNAK
jgi:ATP-dependent DNA helicase PIF1